MASMEQTAPQMDLLRLWRDKNARAVIIQILTIAGLFFFTFWIVSNAVTNLETIGKGYSFDFLFEPAGYDINQYLIEYTNRSSHLTAAVVGLLNTLLVAVTGIILATVVGFILGVLRLSKNLLMGKIVYTYIEVVRNVPVLLWILLVHGMLISSLPSPKASVSDGWDFLGVSFLSNRGFYLPQPNPEPAFWATVIAFFLGIAGAVVFRRHARKVQDATGKILPVFWVSVAAILGLPILVFLVTGLPIVWSFPELKGFNFVGGFAIKPEFMALTLALSLYTSSFIAENVRGGILAVSHGQTEAAHALGISNSRTLQLVVIPQALRVIIPPLTSQYLNLTKNSSLAIAVGYMDIVATIGGISLNQTGREMECMTIVLLVYLCFSLLISAFMNWYNKRIKLIER
ncbi:ABC transporter permease subunit [Rhodospirillaceae bacterium KN72]|uniref:ABC transporter permease subunit n=2 Tax=Pacificispira spongiicola TaxID=2729598 RepID=A0A7Y0DZF2_9PROT|nr:ABC transporter permease subunit [Pacificispira spongiicola]